MTGYCELNLTGFKQRNIPITSLFVSGNCTMVLQQVQKRMEFFRVEFLELIHYFFD